MSKSNLPKCFSCGSEILPLPKSNSDTVIVNQGGMISEIDMGQLYQGQICESCRRVFCTSCWVKNMGTPDRLDVCNECGGHLVPLTSKNLP